MLIVRTILRVKPLLVACFARRPKFFGAVFRERVESPVGGSPRTRALLAGEAER
ncbi:MAG: hypothetical protein ACE5JI_06695 [Acidobacteriota bacterium]